jgi:hypothetical protein
MHSIKSVLAKSSIIKKSYEYSREKVSRYYRRLKRNPGKLERYEELLDESAASLGNNDHRLVENGLVLRPHPDVSNPVLTRGDVDDCLARFVADPFIVYTDGVYNMFFEIKSIGGNVFIGHAFSENGLDYEYNKIVIDPETAQHT